MIATVFRVINNVELRLQDKDGLLRSGPNDGRIAHMLHCGDGAAFVPSLARYCAFTTLHMFPFM